MFVCNCVVRLIMTSKWKLRVSIVRYYFFIFLRIYIRHAEREQFSEQALSMCIQSLKLSLKNLETVPTASCQKMLFDVFRAYQRIQKHVPSKESVFAGLLTDVYKVFAKEKVRKVHHVTSFYEVCTRCRKICLSWTLRLNFASSIKQRRS